MRSPLTFPTLCVLALSTAACGGPSIVKGGPFPGDPANFTYDLGGTKVTLSQGRNEVRTGEGPDDFTSTDLTQAALDADFDGNDSTDRVVVISRDEGYDKRYFVVALLDMGAGNVVATNAVELGTNVLVQDLALEGKGFAVSLLVHEEGAQKDAPPTMPKKRVLRVTAGRLGPAS